MKSDRKHQNFGQAARKTYNFHNKIFKKKDLIAGMHALDFVAKWKQTRLSERASAQEHFLDLCKLLGQKQPAEADPEGKRFTFEKLTRKHDGRTGFADVWYKGHFAWEYKGRGKNLRDAYNQLLQYRGALENPPLLIVSDIETIEIHTNFTNMPEVVERIELEDLAKYERIEKLKWAFTNPDNFKPSVTRGQITTGVAERFANLAQTLRMRGHDPKHVAHFLSKVVFCLFAEDVGLLPEHILSKLIHNAPTPDFFNTMLKELLVTMNEGGRFGYEFVRHFNGGLFSDDIAVPLEADDIKVLAATANENWSAVEPSILGTLFERGLDPSKRSQLGAHYTPRSDIERVIDPVFAEPLQQEWNSITSDVDNLLVQARNTPKKASSTRARNKARMLINTFLVTRVRSARVLDPACGSGNFLYVALEKLHNFEKNCLIKLAEVEHGQLSSLIEVGPHQVMGIELSPYAAELARVTIWIGHLQWRIQNGFGYEDNPVLKTLDSIQCQDAIIDCSDPANLKAPVWPEADYIVGNPPFLGGHVMDAEMGRDYVGSLRSLYKGKLYGQSNLVCYWFFLGLNQVISKKAKSVGFVSTNAIRGEVNRGVLKNIIDSSCLFHALSDEPWVVEGADVRISIICFGEKTAQRSCFLDGQKVDGINSDLSPRNESRRFDVTEANSMLENANIGFKGLEKGDSFEIEGPLARHFLRAPSNPNGKKNAEVLKPWLNGGDVTKRPSDKWIIDFHGLSEEDASLFELPFKHVVENVRKDRKHWWLFRRSGTDVRMATANLKRFLVTARVAKHRFFVWFNGKSIPDSRLFVVSREDDVFFGLLNSRHHEIWSLATCSWHGVGNDPTYNANSCFEAFPFPSGLTPNLKPEAYANQYAEAVATAALRLNELRESWLNPPELVQRAPEVVVGYPDRILPVDTEAARELKKRTLTNLYNAKPTWLTNAHRKLDEAVAAAYGWPADLSDDEVLAMLFELNQERAAATK